MIKMKKKFNLIILIVFLYILSNLGYRFINGISPFSTNHKEMSPEKKQKMMETIKKLNEKNYQNSTFTISNLGMFNIDIFSAIINSPESCILAIGGIKKTLIIKNKKIETGYLMKVNLSCDNRIIDGATGAKFLKNLKKIILVCVFLMLCFHLRMDLHLLKRLES